jgi:hypothetical protein
MVRATRARRDEVTLVPLRTVLALLRKKLLGLVAQIFTSSNALISWLRKVKDLISAA